MSDRLRSLPPTIGWHRFRAVPPKKTGGTIRKVILAGRPIIIPKGGTFSGVVARVGDTTAAQQPAYVSVFCEECRSTVLAVRILEPRPDQPGRALCPDCGPRAWTLRDRLITIDPVPLEA